MIRPCIKIMRSTFNIDWISSDPNTLLVWWLCSNWLRQVTFLLIFSVQSKNQAAPLLTPAVGILNYFWFFLYRICSPITHRCQAWNVKGSEEIQTTVNIMYTCNLKCYIFFYNHKLRLNYTIYTWLSRCWLILFFNKLKSTCLKSLYVLSKLNAV